MESEVDPRLASLYQRSIICKTFPAYRLHELSEIPIAEILIALQLLETAQKVQT